MGRPKRSDARDVRALLLEEAVRVVTESGEQGLRTKAVAAAVGVTEPALFHYFGSREGLIEEVQAHRFRVTQADLFIAFRDAVMKSSSKTQFENAVASGLRASFAKAREFNRAARISIAGSSVSRPRLRERVAEAQRDALAPAVDAIEYARGRGWVRADLDAEAFLLWVVAQTGGRYFAEINSNERVLREWNTTVVRAVFHELGLDPPRTTSRTTGGSQKKARRTT